MSLLARIGSDLLRHVKVRDVLFTPHGFHRRRARRWTAVQGCGMGLHNCTWARRGPSGCSNDL